MLIGGVKLSHGDVHVLVDTSGQPNWIMWLFEILPQLLPPHIAIYLIEGKMNKP